MLYVMHDEFRELRLYADNLRMLANAFSIIGNEKMYEQIMFISNNIYESVDNMSTALTEELNERVNRSQEEVGNTLKLMINNLGKQNEH